RWHARLADAGTLSWGEECRICKSINDEASASNNPMAQAYRVAGSFWDRAVLAQLRLLRTAAHYLAAGDFLELEDPFGTILHHSRVNGSTRIWSVSLNGVDDSGIGRWDWRRPIPNKPHWPDWPEDI